MHFDEGLGTVYERFMLNNFFDVLMHTYPIREVLEVPLYGMTGLTGINSAHFADTGCMVTLVDSKKEKIHEATQIWQFLPHNQKTNILHHKNLSKLPFEDSRFDLVWNFAALWHVKEADLLLSEMIRVSSNLILIMVPNKKQLGYLLRKYVLDKAFFEVVDETWAEVDKVSSVLTSLGAKMKERGVLDVPPWPDTCMPLSQILEIVRICKNRKVKASKGGWSWDIMSYYLGKDQSLKKKVERFSFLERMPLPWQLKAFWAHHQYVLFSKY
jgi:SAM-dependent methyltransferase